jgi:hypothetical protein
MSALNGEEHECFRFGWEDERECKEQRTELHRWLPLFRVSSSSSIASTSMTSTTSGESTSITTGPLPIAFFLPTNPRHFKRRRGGSDCRMLHIQWVRWPDNVWRLHKDVVTFHCRRFLLHPLPESKSSTTLAP